MIPAEDVVVILLAAGGSTRFGPRDKLAEPLDGLPLGLHAARTIGRLPFAARIAVTRAGGPDFRSYGFVPVENPAPDRGQSGSIVLGIAHARRVAPKAVLIALADMPFVTPSHIQALLARFDHAHPIVASTDGSRKSPPALFGAALFDQLADLRGDMGARQILRDATLVDAPSADLADIDTPADLRPCTNAPPG